LKTKNNILLGSIGISPQKELIDMLNSIWKQKTQSKTGFFCLFFILNNKRG
jgi:hypothetical protein